MIDVSIQVPERLFFTSSAAIPIPARDHLLDSLPNHVYQGQIREWDRIADPRNQYLSRGVYPAQPAEGNICRV